MSQGDPAAIMALEQELFPEDAWTRQMFAAEFAQPVSRRLYLVAEEGKELVGYAGMMFTGGSQADVVTVTTSGPTELLASDQVTIAGVTDTSFNGTFAIASIVDSLHFTYAQTNSNATS